MRSWLGLMKREYLEHRVSFLWFPLGILALLALAGASAIGFNRSRLGVDIALTATRKFFEVGFVATAALWWAYLGFALFFYFGDAFTADRRNNAMFFWKSMPVSDFKILLSKFLSGIVLFPAIVFVIALVTGALHFILVNVAVLALPGLVLPPPLELLASYGQVAIFVLGYLVLSLLWYAPFLAWVGGLSAVFGRWSLALAFVIPGVVAILENILLYGNEPRGGYVWRFLSERWKFGLTDADYGAALVNVLPFDASYYLGRLTHEIDWASLGAGLVFALVVIFLASAYRRRRLN